MKITNISCTQFAGVRDRSVSFTDGVNVIYGKNETGKSTLVNLLSRTLFQKAKVDRRKDKEFLEVYFPGARKGNGIAGDFADGKITFVADGRTYTLSKEWGADPRCTLSTPDGVIRDQNKIDGILTEALRYGEGVYSDMLLSSQRNTDASLQTILDASRKTDAKQEITDAVSQAFAQSDGISMDAIEQAIDGKISEIAGKHWDPVRQVPVRKAGRWANGLGRILETYYALEDAREDLEKISDLESEADRTAAAYTKMEESARTAEGAFNRFQTFASRLAIQQERKERISRMERDLSRITDVQDQWPRLDRMLKNAESLRTERANRQVWDVWNYVKAVQEEISGEDRRLAELPCPESEEIRQVRKYQREISTLENKLCGMNLHAAIRMLNGDSVQVVALRTGEEIDLSGGAAAITEAVKITIPGVMEMQLSPANVDVAAIEGEIARKKSAVAGIFEKYQVSSLDELESYAQKIIDAQGKIQRAEQKIARVLGDVSLEQLEARRAQAGDLHREKEEIEQDISRLCGGEDLGVFLTRTKTVMEGYDREYGSLDALEDRARGLREELEQARESVSGVEDIPAEYLSIADPDGYLERLKEDWNQKKESRDGAFQKKSGAASDLEAYKAAHPEACPETVEMARKKFEETKSLLEHWNHIAEVFRAQKALLHDNPMQDIADRFAHYLSTISGGSVTSEFPEGDKLNMHIYSGNNLLDYGKLSEGTKETVSLAFRLAVLDHLFPDGGGVIVFDDPFADMDAERAERSCRLVRECAQRHQVIFLTCREDYLDALEGNLIRF